MTLKVVTANRLRDGRVVYLGESGSWSESIADGRLVSGEEDDAEILAAAQADAGRARVVDPYFIEVATHGGTIHALGNREAIRAQGPSVRPDVGKQAQDG